MKKALQIFAFIAIALLSGSNLYGQKGGDDPKPPTPPNPYTTINQCQLYVPNAFTPNGDGINDQFSLKYNDACNVLSFEMRIFDRWGRLVYHVETPDPTRAWDGNFDGKMQKEGIYMWKLSAKLIDPSKNEPAEIINKQGTVVLIR